MSSGDAGTSTLRLPRRYGISERALESALALLREAREDVDALSRLEGGGVVGDFEQRFASYVDARSAVSTSSGTSALMAALLACGVAPGDEVIVAAYGWGGTAGAVALLGATPVFADIEPVRLGLDPASARQCLSSRTKAILATHMFGQPADIRGLTALASESNIKLIFDSAQALGATYEGKPIGAWGDINTFSFGRGKLLSTGEGGMATTDDPDLYERLVLASQHPLRARRDLEDRALRAAIDEVSLSSRIHPLAAVIGVAELRRTEARLHRRRQACLTIADKLEEVPGLRFVGDLCRSTNAFHRLAMTCVCKGSGGRSRHEILERLRSAGFPVVAGPVRTPLHMRTNLRGLDRRSGAGCEVSEARCREGELVLEIPSLAQPGCVLEDVSGIKRWRKGPMWPTLMEGAFPVRNRRPSVVSFPSMVGSSCATRRSTVLARTPMRSLSLP